MRQRRPHRPSHVKRATMARLTRRVGNIARRVQRLEGHRRRIGFRARREEIDTDVQGEVWDQDDPAEDL